MPYIASKDDSKFDISKVERLELSLRKQDVGNDSPDDFGVDVQSVSLGQAGIDKHNKRNRMSSFFARSIALIATTSLCLAQLRAEVVTVDASNPPPPSTQRIVMGSAKSPSGSELTIDGTCLSIDGKPWLGVMGEFHYSRYPANEWRDELLKMKAGGISIVSCYVFWIHHEEIEGQFDWTGQRDLHKFVALCGELGLRVVVRCGPWDHGEVRNGGFPDWLLTKGYKLRSDDPGYLSEVQKLYAQIAKQLAGLLWKDGGPVIGIQLENEYRGRPQHLLTLKKLAREAGLDVPVYTRTGWPDLPKPIAFGELLPLYGGYAEGFWDRALTTMPGDYWKEFIFQPLRTDTAVANDHFGQREAKDDADTRRYPYLTCELGAGMMCSYHRRITVLPRDAISIAMVKLGSGSNLPGYYMYHGGTNPDSKTGITLQEAQKTNYTNYNDLPTRTYDFQTALGEFGQVRPQYHLLRRLHLFLNDFGPPMTHMAALFPERKPAGKTDSQTLRWSMRTDGRSGFIFVNNYQRLLSMPAKPQTQFKIKLAGDELTIPQSVTTIPADATFLWPFNLDLGDGVRLFYATAQPVCQIDDGGVQYTFFTTIGSPAEFCFNQPQSSIKSDAGSIKASGDTCVVSEVTPSTSIAIEIKPKSGKTRRIVLLDDSQSLQLWKGKLAGADRVILTPANVIFDGDELRLRMETAGAVPVDLLPAANLSEKTSQDGVFQQVVLEQPARDPVVVNVRETRPPDAPRDVPIGRSKVAQAPSNADFDRAGVWQIDLPNIDSSRRWLLKIAYAGDVARAYAGDYLLTDNFYNGTSFDIGLNRFSERLKNNSLTVKILPLRADAPIYMLDRVRPDFEGKTSVAKLLNATLVEETELVLRPRLKGNE